MRLTNAVTKLKLKRENGLLISIIEDEREKNIKERNGNLIEILQSIQQMVRVI